MKKAILTILAAGILSVCQAQVPDSTRKMKSSSTYRTDSVKRGNEVYNGTKSHKNRSNGDTLATPKKGGKGMGPGQK